MSAPVHLIRVRDRISSVSHRDGLVPSFIHVGLEVGSDTLFPMPSLELSCPSVLCIILPALARVLSWLCLHSPHEQCRLASSELEV